MASRGNMRNLTVVFDLDGTLVDTAPDLVAATSYALDDLSLAPIPAMALTPWVGFGARRMIEEGLRQSRTQLSDPEVDRLLARFLAHYEMNIARESRPFDGAVDALNTLKDAGARLAVCTNKRENLSRLLLEALHLAPLFDAIAGRDTFAVSKPHPEHLLGAIRLAGGDSRAAVMVGDTNVDIETAKAARVPSIAVTFGYSSTPVLELGADLTIAHYGQLLGALAAIRPRPVSPSLR